MRPAAARKDSLHQLVGEELVEAPTNSWDCSGTLDRELVGLQKVSTEWGEFGNTTAERHGIKTKG